MAVSLDFYTPYWYAEDPSNFPNNSSISVFPLPFPESVPWKNINFGVVMTGGVAVTGTVSAGLYTMNNGTLSLTNSASGTTLITSINGKGYIPLGTISASSFYDPGMYYLGVGVSTLGTTLDLLGLSTNTSVTVENAYPGAFQAGRWTVGTTNAMPGSMATTDMDMVANTNNEYGFPYIILSS